MPGTSSSLGDESGRWDVFALHRMIASRALTFRAWGSMREANPGLCFADPGLTSVGLQAGEADEPRRMQSGACYYHCDAIDAGGPGQPPALAQTRVVPSPHAARCLRRTRRIPEERTPFFANLEPGTSRNATLNDRLQRGGTTETGQNTPHAVFGPELRGSDDERPERTSPRRSVGTGCFWPEGPTRTTPG